MAGDGRSVELLTARAAGGIAVLRLRGEARFALAARVLSGSPPDAVPRRRWLVVDGERIDEALVLARTDEASVELHVHGSLAVLQALERVFGPLLPPPATARTRLLGECLGTGQLDFALEQVALLSDYAGDFGGWVEAHAADVAALRGALAGHARVGELMVALPLALVGRKNVGKSTLMNRLLFRERVLAGAQPGLTRDPVRETVELDGYVYELIDTAGEGEALDALDAAAMARSRSARRAAAIALVVDAAVGVAAVERALLRQHPDAAVVRTKADLGGVPWPADLAPPLADVSCRDAADAAAVRATVGPALRRWRCLPPAGACGHVVAVDADEVELLRRRLGAAHS